MGLAMFIPALGPARAKEHEKLEHGLEIAGRSLWVERDSFQMKLETQGKTML